jgi:hypothetical protein
MLKSTTFIGFILCFALGVTGATDTAKACGNGVEYRISDTVEKLSIAEGHLNQDRLNRAVAGVVQVFPKPKKLSPGRGGTTDRALRILATAIVRLDGDVAGNGFESTTEAQKGDNLRWAAYMLRGLSLQRPDDVGLQTLLGEAQAALPQKQVEALELLSRLEAEDRMAGPRGYAALARLRRALSHGQPSFLSAPLQALSRAQVARAEERCRRMSRGATYCTAAAASDAAG